MQNPKTKNSVEDLVSVYGQSAVDRELKQELESKSLAHARYMSCLSKSMSEGQLTKASLNVIKEALEPFRLKIEGYLQESTQGHTGRLSSASKWVSEVPSEVLAYIPLKTILPLSLKSQGELQLAGVCLAIGRNVISERDAIKTLSVADKAARNGISKRLGETYKQVFIRNLAKRYLDEGRLQESDMYRGKVSNADLLKIGLKLVELLAESTGMVKIQKRSVPKGVMYFLQVDNLLLDYIRHSDSEIADLVYLKRPMLVKPLDWTTPFNGGYFLKFDLGDALIKLKKEALKFYSDVDMSKVYEAVNAIQATPWRINKRLYEIASQIASWRYIPDGLDMASSEPSDKPMRPIEADSDATIQKTWRKDMLRWYQSDNSRKGKRILVDILLSEAKRYVNEGAIYFPHQLDFRGRIYPMTLLSPQGNDLNKGLLEFAEGVPLGDQGAKWLAFHGANLWGLDKKPIQERLTWVYENREFISRVAREPLDFLEWTNADSPWEFLAFCFEWSDYLATGETYVSHMAVAFDGSCSGLQHYSAMLRDEIGATAVNLIPSETVQDIYGIVAKKVNARLNEDVKSGTVDEFKTDKEGTEYLQKGTQSLAAEWLTYGVTRRVTKRSVMTLCYGSRQYGFGEQVYEDTVLPSILSNPLSFSRPKQASTYMAKLIWDSVQEVVVKAVEGMNWLQEVSTLLADQKDVLGQSLPVYWMTPAGFPVRQAYPKRVLKRVRLSTGEGFQYAVEDLSNAQRGKNENNELWLTVGEDKKDDLDKRKQRQGIAPNFVHSMDASHLMLTVCACVSQGIYSFAMVHDSYGTHAGNAETLFKTVREVFVDTYEQHDVLMELYEHCQNLLPESALGDLHEPPSKGNLDLSLVKQSLYAFS